ncbi:hypothetical protein ACIGQE_32450 [Streptomyces sp. NPDC053429]|uniref:hypothetical protein n=1 Tax=unclassified Streptomyces TaxID=2593676 RepID=UPI0033E090EE
MAIKKATIQQQVADAIAQINPADRPIVTIQAIAGPSVWLMSMLGLIGQMFLTYYFVTVTEQAVVLHKASRMSNRPQEIVFAIPPAQAVGAVTEVKRNAVWSSFRFQLPGQEKPTRMNVHRLWRNEMDQVIGLLTNQSQPVA